MKDGQKRKTKNRQLEGYQVVVEFYSISKVTVAMSSESVNCGSHRRVVELKDL